MSTPSQPARTASTPANTAPTRTRSARPSPPRPPTTSLSPLVKKDFGFDQARHLLWRAGFGGTPDQVQTLVNWGLEKSVNMLVDYEGIAFEEVSPTQFSADIMRPPSEDERRMARQAAAARNEDRLAELRLRRQNAEQADREQMRDVQRWWLKRMIETPRPLEEKMTLLWHGHFATNYRTIEDSYHMFQQNQLFRKHATGNFGELLFAIIRDPAMLAYLNNNQSRRGRPNENLARELMELFSLGVGNYTEGDIKEGARALTGYTFQDDQFVFQKNNHDAGGKSILGRSGNLDGDGFVNAILEQPACSQFIAGKLYRAFVHDYPSGDERIDTAARTVIGDLAALMRAESYQIKPVLRRLFLSQHFYDAGLRGEQIKSPVQLIVGAIRSLNTPPRDLGLLCDAANMMGQNIFFPPSVKGWDGGRSWINTSTLFVRQNTLVFLLTGKRPQGRDALADKEQWNPSPLLSQLADAFPEASSGDLKALLDAILSFSLGRTNPVCRPILDQFVASRARNGKLDADSLTDLLMLITAAPEYQLC